MPITIGRNIASIQIQRQLDLTSERLGTVYERLSSGQRINSAADDAAGLSVASSLNARSRIYSKSLQNVNDAASVVAVASGALDNLTQITQRQLELASQAANGTYSAKQRSALQLESSALTNEYNRIVNSTSFNGVQLLDGTNLDLRIQHGFGQQESTLVATGSIFGNAVGDGTFTIGTSVGGAGGQGLAVADFNSDGSADFVALASGAGGKLVVSLGNGDGTFKTSVSVAGPTTVTNANKIKTGDLDGDGNIDLIWNDQGTVFSAKGRGDGTFDPSVSQNIASDGISLSIADINNDGRLDVMLGQAAAITYAFGRGDGTFGSATSVSAFGEVNVHSVGAFDFNSDGNADLFWSSPNNSSVRVRLGRGDGTFGSTAGVDWLITAPGFDPYAAEVGDVNNDGVLDVITASGGGTGAYRALIGNGNETFTLGSSFALGTSSGVQLGLSDMNGDGNLDILAGSDNNATLLVHFGNGDGTFEAAQTSVGTLGSTDLTIDVADFDGDGAKDVLRGGGGTYSEVLIANVDSSRRANTVEHFSISTIADARLAIPALKKRLGKIAQELGSLGATQSRLSAVSSTLAVRREGYNEAFSRIIDADVAEESANLLRQQVLQQSAAAVLARANIQPQVALKLLQD